MNRQHVEFTVSGREVVILLLLAAGAWLRTISGPSAREEVERIWGRSLASRIVGQHNATAFPGVQKLSELTSAEREKATSALVVKEAAQTRAVVRRIYLAALAHLAAACCWLAAVLTLLVHVRSEWRESVGHPVTGLDGRMEGPEPLDRRVAVRGPA